VKYNALQIGLRKRVSKGLSFQASYTLGRTTGDVENVGLYSTNGSWKNYSGYKLGSDRLQVLNINYTYEAPKLAEKIGFDNAFGRALLNGWRIAHTYLLFSGQDFSPGFSIQQANTTTNVDLNKVLLGTPDLAPRLVVQGDVNTAPGDMAHQFDPNQLAVPGIYPAGDGTGDRNFVKGRGSFANDVSVVKRFSVGAKRGLELRANFYNVFNQTRLTGTNGTVQYKAKGRTYADGFDIFNTPEQLQARAEANGVTNPTQLFNQYRSGVGHVNLGSDEPARIIEIGVAFRF